MELEGAARQVQQQIAAEQAVLGIVQTVKKPKAGLGGVFFVSIGDFRSVHLPQYSQVIQTIVIDGARRMVNRVGVAGDFSPD